MCKNPVIGISGKYNCVCMCMCDVYLWCGMCVAFVCVVYVRGMCCVYVSCVVCAWSIFGCVIVRRVCGLCVCELWCVCVVWYGMCVRGCVCSWGGEGGFRDPLTSTSLWCFSHLHPSLRWHNCTPSFAIIYTWNAFSPLITSLDPLVSTGLPFFYLVAPWDSPLEYTTHGYLMSNSTPRLKTTGAQDSPLY